MAHSCFSKIIFLEFQNYKAKPRRIENQKVKSETKNLTPIYFVILFQSPYALESQLFFEIGSESFLAAFFAGQTRSKYCPGQVFVAGVDKVEHVVPERFFEIVEIVVRFLVRVEVYFWPDLTIEECGELAKESAERFEKLLRRFEEEGLDLYTRIKRARV